MYQSVGLSYKQFHHLNNVCFYRAVDEEWFVSQYTAIKHSRIYVISFVLLAWV
jgi:hypothetical protein